MEHNQLSHTHTRAHTHANTHTHTYTHPHTRRYIHQYTPNRQFVQFTTYFQPKIGRHGRETGDAAPEHTVYTPNDTKRSPRSLYVITRFLTTYFQPKIGRHGSDTEEIQEH
jgi:hypothetical protein